MRVIAKESDVNSCNILGWKRCKVDESFHIPRCYKCSTYGHFAKNWKSSEAASAYESDFSKYINCLSSNNIKLIIKYEYDRE